MSNETSIPTTLRKAGIRSVSTNCGANQTITLKAGALGLFFGDELAQRLLAKQQQEERAHG